MGFKPGFRLSIIDTSFILVAVIGSVFFYQQEQFFISTMLFVPTLQFFLFCNIFRIRRLAELAWAGFYLITFYTAYTFHFTPLIPTTITLILGIIIIGIEIYHPSYHGIFWQRINPNLPQWFKDKH